MRQHCSQGIKMIENLSPLQFVTIILLSSIGNDFSKTVFFCDTLDEVHACCFGLNWVRLYDRHSFCLLARRQYAVNFFLCLAASVFHLREVEWRRIILRTSVVVYATGDALNRQWIRQRSVWSWQAIVHKRTQICWLGMRQHICL